MPGGFQAHHVCRGPDAQTLKRDPARPGGRRRLAVRESGRPFTVGVRGAFGANDIAAVHLAALGIAMLPEIQVSDDVRHGRLVQVLNDWPVPRTPAFILYPARRNLAPRTSVVIDFVIDPTRQLRLPVGA